MLELSAVETLARSEANTAFGAANVVRIDAEPMLDSYGDEALSVRVVLEEAAVAAPDGIRLLNFLSKLRDRLEENGDGRFPIINYATEAELAAADE